jgi:hypothetical protein
MLYSAYKPLATNLLTNFTPKVESTSYPTASSLVADSKPASITPFSALATERRSTLEKIADVISGVLQATGVSVNASGSGIQVTQAPPAGSVTGGSGYMAAPKPIYENPLFIGGAALVLAVLLLRK